jgi:MIP family channel proteins
MKQPLSHRLVAEAIGTFAIVFFGCGAIMMLERVPSAMTPTVIPVIFGLVVGSMIYAFGHLSGAHFNPAVTLAFAVARHFPFREVLIYWSAQLLGAFIAAGLLYYLFPSGSTYGATVPHVTVTQAFAWEFVMTFLLMVVIMGVSTDTRAVGVMAGAAIGAVVALDAFVGGWATGASMNPARSLAPAIVQGELGSVWIYLLAPVGGAVAGALTYRVIGRQNG